ncbi:MAG: DUF5679 domain-containing protein [Candidatus Limnocylindrales bacterium]
MAKRSRPTDPPIEAGTPPADGDKAHKRLKRLERELAELGATEARRLEQLKEVRARAADVRTRFTALRTMDAAAGRSADPAATPAGPIGYCLREKRPVEISDPEPVTLSNGRTAIAGTCSTCGARIVALPARASPTDN